MPHSLIRLIKWFCRRLTYNELSSAVVIFLEILNNTRKDIPLKPDEKPPHYRQFRVDQLAPVPAPEKPPQMNWRLIKKIRERETGKSIKPVERQNGKKPPPGCICGHCNAPGKFLYLNNGKLQSQVKCKICNQTSPSHGNKRTQKTKYFCPHCSSALFKWKQSKQSTIYKCSSYTCSHYLSNKARLTKEEQDMRQKQRYTPNFKLHYQYREYHISPADLISSRPPETDVHDLGKIHHNHRTLGLVLTFSINLGLSSRVTRDAIKGLFGISLSHQTVINYINLAARYLTEFIDQHSPAPQAACAADETYIIVENKWTYTWFIIDSQTRAICGYNLSNHRGMQPALALLYNCFGRPDDTACPPDLVTDGNPSYDAAVLAYNDMIKNDESKLRKRTVIGLQNLDEQSSEYRSFKQLVERLNRTYKYHTRPRAGFKSFDGAISLTTLFVAFYNFMRPHSALKKSTPVAIDAIDNQPFLPDKWVALIESAAA